MEGSSESRNSSFRSNVSMFSGNVNRQLKPYTETICLWIVLIVVVFAIVVYIITSFITENAKLYIYLAGYTLIAGSTIVLFLFVNLCLNYRRKV